MCVHVYSTSLFHRGGFPTRQEFTLTHWMQLELWKLCLAGKNLCCKLGFVKLQIIVFNYKSSHHVEHSTNCNTPMQTYTVSIYIAILHRGIGGSVSYWSRKYVMYILSLLNITWAVFDCTPLKGLSGDWNLYTMLHLMCFIGCEWLI